jgi:hypothetical protein
MEGPAGKGFDIRGNETPFTESDPSFRNLTGIKQGDELKGYSEVRGKDSPWWAEVTYNAEVGPFSEVHEILDETYRELLAKGTTHKQAFIAAWKGYKKRAHYTAKALETGRYFLRRAKEKGDKETLRRVVKLYGMIRNRVPKPFVLEYSPVIEDLAEVNDKQSRCSQEDDSYHSEHSRILQEMNARVPCFRDDGSKLPFPELFPHRARQAEDRKARFAGLVQWVASADAKLLAKAFNEAGQYCDGKWLVDYRNSGPFVQRANNVKPYRTSKYTVIERHLDPDDRLVTTGQAIVLKYLARCRLGWKISPKFKSLAQQCGKDLGLEF